MASQPEEAVAWQPTARGRHLAGRQNRNTGPEMALRSALHRLGLRFRLHKRLAPGCTPDVLLPRHRLAIFVDGCFWHGCPLHGRKTPFTGPNARLWEDKMRRNLDRDLRADEIATALGFAPVRVWECEIARDPSGCAQQVAALAAQRQDTDYDPRRLPLA